MKNSSHKSFQYEVLKSAKEYASLGWYVFPVHSIDSSLKCTCGNQTCSDAGKHPRVARGLKEASTDPAKIESWFGEGAPLANIGIVTGEISGITVIDIDIGEGKFGAESWAEAIKDHGEPQTLMAETGSGGMHVVFKYNSALKTSSNTLGKGVDCRNDGGYIVAAPSRHRSGGTYKWLNWGDELATLPAHLSRRKETRGKPKRDDTHNNKYSITQVASMLEVVPADDRDLWRSVGIILGREFNRVDEAWSVYQQWADKVGGKKGRNHDEIMHEAFYVLSQENLEKELSVGTIVKAAVNNGWAPTRGGVPIESFVYFAPANNYIYKISRSHWIEPSVNAAVSPINVEGKIISATEWLKRNRLVTSMTCAPKFKDDYIEGLDSRFGEIIKSEGSALFNTYRHPTIILGDSNQAKPFIEQVHKLFNKEGDAEQFLNYMAHRVQKPWEKPRFALLIGGGQGVGKDTAVEMCVPAIGSWNVAEIGPADLEQSFNEYSAATLVRISEAANLHEMSRWAFNEKTKVLIAGLPDTCLVNPKYGQKYTVRMFCGVVLTTNHLTNGLHIPPDDRRYDVIETATIEEMGFNSIEEKNQYFNKLWAWFIEENGASHVAAYLHEKDISQFSASNGQRKTQAHKSIVMVELEQYGWFFDIVNEFQSPEFISVPTIKRLAERNGEIDTSKNNHFQVKIKHAALAAGYVRYPNPNSSEGRWTLPGINTGFIIYARKDIILGRDPREFVKKQLDIF
jgi:Bifunctional DNA primase/polymerase, N-terminal/Family of unknown function (DUF5906)